MVFLTLFSVSSRVGSVICVLDSSGVSVVLIRSCVCLQSLSSVLFGKCAFPRVSLVLLDCPLTSVSSPACCSVCLSPPVLPLFEFGLYRLGLDLDSGYNY